MNPKNRKGIVLDGLKIASAYSKDNAQNFINSSEILYVDKNKKRVSRWNKLTRLQLPVSLSNANSTDSLSPSTENVNKIQKSDRVYLNAVESGDMETAQRMVDEALEDALKNSEAKSTQNGTQNKSNQYSLRPYSQKQIENWSNSSKIVIYENDSQVRKFVEDALEKKNLGQKIYFGILPSELTEKIKKEFGVDLTGYNCALKAKEVLKIIGKSHGNEVQENLRGQRAITVEDILSIPKIIQNPDKILDAGTTSEGKPALSFVKTLNGKTTVVSYVSDKKHDLYVQTMYASKKIEALLLQMM